jgi:hypothetical protein
MKPPVPPAYRVLFVPVMVAAVPPDQLPESRPVVSVIVSPEAGIDQETTGGNRSLIALKNVPRDAVASAGSSV